MPDSTGQNYCAVASLALYIGVIMPGESAQWVAELFLKPSATHGEKAIYRSD